MTGKWIETPGGAAADLNRYDQLNALREVLVAMVYVHPCQCGKEIPKGMCARCRSVKVLGFDPAVIA